MDYVTRISHWMQNQLFGITCSTALFVQSVLVPPEHENSELTFHALDAP
jgi:hypothetical protein